MVLFDDSLLGVYVLYLCSLFCIPLCLHGEYESVFCSPFSDLSISDPYVSHHVCLLTY